MKLYIIVTCFLAFLFNNKTFAQVGVQSNTPAPTAILDLRPVASGLKQGIVPPQVSLTNLTSGSPIVGGTPAIGLIVYNTNAALPGGLGYYYWESSKWNKMLNTGDVTGDNLGNHTATQDLNMANYSINQAAKTSVQTEAIALGTDGNPPAIGNVATAADASGNVVWRPYPDMKGSTSVAFTTSSTAMVSPSATLGSWTAIPGVSNYNYTATATGTLILKAVIPVALNDATTAVKAIMYQTGVRFTAKTGGTVIAAAGGTAYGFATIVGSSVTIAKSGKNPNSIIILTQFPVTNGVTYNLNLECSDFYRVNDTKPSMFGSIVSLNGNTYTSIMSGVLIPN